MSIDSQFFGTVWETESKVLLKEYWLNAIHPETSGVVSFTTKYHKFPQKLCEMCGDKSGAGGNDAYHRWNHVFLLDQVSV